MIRTDYQIDLNNTNYNHEFYQEINLPSVTPYHELENYSNNSDLYQLMREVQNMFKERKESHSNQNPRNFSNNNNSKLKLNLNPNSHLNPFNLSNNSINNTSQEPNTHWIEIFKGIEHLRRMRKYLPDLFKTIFNNIINEFCELINNSNISISRVCLLLLGEVFHHTDTSEKDTKDSLDVWIRKSLPFILSRAVCEYKMLREEAIAALEQLVDNVFFPETLLTLLENSVSKQQGVSNLSYTYLKKFLENLDNYTLMSIYETIEWEEVLNYLEDLYLIRKEVYLKKAFEFIDYLDKTFASLYECHYLNVIFNEVSDQRLQENFKKLLLEKETSQNLMIKKIESKNKLESARKSILSDKRRSIGSKDSIRRFESEVQVQCPVKNYPNSHQPLIKNFGREFPY